MEHRTAAYVIWIKLSFLFNVQCVQLIAFSVQLPFKIRNAISSIFICGIVKNSISYYYFLAQPKRKNSEKMKRI